ncbi:MAG: Hpt domain-containing protein [Bacteroidota bacterium]
MIKSESEKSIENVCDLNYLTEMMGGKKHLIRGIMDTFLKQVPEELQSINEAITKKDYAVIKNFAHTMKSSVSIMGITVLAPVLQEMEDLGSTSGDIEKIKKLNQKLNLICKQAIEEIEIEKYLYV